MIRAELRALLAAMPHKTLTAFCDEEDGWQLLNADGEVVASLGRGSYQEDERAAVAIAVGMCALPALLDALDTRDKALRACIDILENETGSPHQRCGSCVGCLRSRKESTGRLIVVAPCNTECDVCHDCRTRKAMREARAALEVAP